jgi:hypothetical protein
MILRFLALVLFTFSLQSVGVAKQLDFTNQSDADGTYYIAFCVRASPGSTGLPGHLFVSYSFVNNSGQRDFLSIGHTVSSGASGGAVAWSYFGNAVNGYLKEENYTAISQNCLDVKVNKSDYDEAYAYTRSPLELLGITGPDTIVFEAYRLGLNDCVEFMISVAKVLEPKGLVVPSRGATELPVEYLQRFIDAN